MVGGQGQVKFYLALIKLEFGENKSGRDCDPVIKI